MIDLVKTVIGFIVICLLLASELYGLMRLIISVLLLENTTTKVLAFLGILLLLPVILYIDFALIYVIGGGH
jgi:hypothetical protein